MDVKAVLKNETATMVLLKKNLVLSRLNIKHNIFLFICKPKHLNNCV